MDLDGDGIGDILTGSWPGELYFFKGKGKGDFAAPVKLQRDGQDINLGPSSTVFAADWRSPGRLDLLVGNMRGELYLIPNDGSNAKPAYGAPRKLEAGGRPIIGPHHGDAEPVAADWDGDGLLDLLVGWGDGSVAWYRNVGSRTEPKLAQGVKLVPAAAPRTNATNAASWKAEPGLRAKICVVDWNGEGRLDLLVGDFGGISAEKAELSEQDHKSEQEAKGRLQELQQKIQPFYDEYAKRLRVPTHGDRSAQGRRERQRQAQELLQQPKFQALQKEMQAVTATLEKFRRPAVHQGHVWLYLRRPP